MNQTTDAALFLEIKENVALIIDHTHRIFPHLPPNVALAYMNEPCRPEHRAHLAAIRIASHRLARRLPPYCSAKERRQERRRRAQLVRLEIVQGIWTRKGPRP